LELRTLKIGRMHPYETPVNICESNWRNITEDLDFQSMSRPELFVSTLS